VGRPLFLDVVWLHQSFPGQRAANFRERMSFHPRVSYPSPLRAIGSRHPGRGYLWIAQGVTLPETLNCPQMPMKYTKGSDTKRKEFSEFPYGVQGLTILIPQQAIT
jgi:hypothetical protein